MSACEKKVEEEKKATATFNVGVTVLQVGEVGASFNSPESPTSSLSLRLPPLMTDGKCFGNLPGEKEGGGGRGDGKEGSGEKKGGRI